MRMNGPDDLSSSFEEARTNKYKLQLFVAGMTPRSLNAVQALHDFCEKHLEDRCEIEVIDIYREPERARQENLVVAPTLIKKLPEPLVKFIGDLSREDILLKGLDLKEQSSGS